ncbi:MAG TPA: PDZ domain-containing protein [Pseudonocardiaceae bacterium]|nr:PDZ domain-containing protein [Pseudonocardiaceae bacterium]
MMHLSRWLASAAVLSAVIAIGSLPGTAAAATSQTYYVSTSGNDSNAGTSPTQPLRTLPAAQGKVRQALAAGIAPSVEVAGGTYQLSGALTLGPQDSGTPASPVSWHAAAGQQVRIAGGRQVQATWSPDPSRAGVFTAQVGGGLKMDGLFVNGQRQVLARFPNFDPNQPILNGFSTLSAIQSRAAHWAHPQLADLRALHCNTWGGASFKVNGHNADGTLALTWVGDNNRQAACANPALPLDPNHVVAENALEELDAPGEWYYDSTAGTLYYFPPTGTNPSTAVIQTAEQDELIHVEGTSNTQPAHDITFAGFTFAATHRTLFDHPYEGLQLGDWAVARTGAFYTKNAQDITVTKSVFDQLGGNGVFMDGFNSGNVVSGNKFSGDGGTDVQTVGSRAAVRDPSTWANQVRTLTDTTPGPKTNDYPRNITISGNEMANNGRFEKETAGVNISMSQNIKVIGNTIHGSPRACLNINDGTWGGDLIQNNDIFDCVKETGDHGPINMWGRDRFWPLSASDATQKQDALLDVTTPNVIDHNRIWHNSEWNLDLDDGASNYQLTNNLLLNAGIKLRDGFFRTVKNNILVNGSIFEQVSHADDGDDIEHNITLSAQPYSLTQSDPTVAKYTVDHNLFWDNGNSVSGLGGSWAAAGLDTHSLVRDPAFTAGNPFTSPSMLDYTVASTSPALGLGFTNFAMNNFGVAGAPTPPPVGFPGAANNTVAAQPEPLMGATVTSVFSDAIQSSVGLGDKNGVYLQTVPSTSYAAANGLKTGDVIRAINGNQVTDRNSFWTRYNSAAGGSTLALSVWRNQATVSVSLPKSTAADELNDTAGVVYTGTGWDWKDSTRGGSGSFQGDLWASTHIGDSYSITFNGTGIDLITETNTDEGMVDIFLDGTLATTINCATSTRAFQSQVFSRSGLTAGVHTLKAVMKSGTYLITDAFRVR